MSLIRIEVIPPMFESQPLSISVNVVQAMFIFLIVKKKEEREPLPSHELIFN